MKTLVSDIHTCADKINDLFGSAIGEDSKETVTLEGTMWSNPAKLCYTVRQALREVAVGRPRSFLKNISAFVSIE